MTTGTAITVVEIEVPIYRATQFEFAVSGETIANWEQHDGSGTVAFVGVTDDNSLSGKVAQLSRAAGNVDTGFIWTRATEILDCSILALATASAGVGLNARAKDDDYYQLFVENDTAAIYAVIGGSFTLLASITLEFNIDDLQIWMRFDAITISSGVQLRGKIWTGEPEDEPDDFMISFEDTAILVPTSPIGHAGVGIFTANSRANVEFFRVRSVLDETETLRFAKPTKDLPYEFDVIPSLSRINVSSAVVSLGKDLGKRAEVTLDFVDHPWADLGEFYNDGTFWGKFRARKLFRRGNALTIRRGYTDQDLDSFINFYYLLDTFDGPSLHGGVYTIKSQDILKFADDQRAKAPLLSNGVLAGSIDNVATSATLSPVNIGDTEYPTSGTACIAGKEIVTFTRSGEQLSITRGQMNTTAISHDAGARVQLVLNYSGDDVADIIADLLENYAGIDTSYIPIAEWQAETAAHLAVIYARPITEPTPVRKLLAELIEQAALALWWDDQAQLIRLRVLREISTDADTFDEDKIVLGSLITKEQFDDRISQIWTHFGQRNATDRGDDEDNYRNALATVDLEAELEYGSQEIRSIKGTWIQTETAAERLNQIQISRFRDPPRNFRFDLFAGEAITLGNGYRLKWRQNQNEYGNPVDTGAPIQITRVAVDEGLIHVEAEEMLASGEIVLTNTVFLTTTGSLLSFTVPDTWNSSDNSVHCIGGGGGGGGGNGDGGGNGGGGGAYSSVTNLTLTPSSSVSYRVGDGSGGGAQGISADDGGDTWFNGATLAASSVGAKGGKGGFSLGPIAEGGQAADGVGTLKTSGGDGGFGADKGSTRAGGGGGGGAGGPNGDGGDGGSFTPGDANKDAGAGGGGADGGEDGTTANNNNWNPGGDNRFNFGGGTSGTPSGQQGGGGVGGDDNPAQPGGPGGNGEQLWTQTIAPITSAGPGGGGGGGGSRAFTATDGKGGTGGNYGGGGGGGGGDPGSSGGDGTDGIIVLIWHEA